MTATQIGDGPVVYPVVVVEVAGIKCRAILDSGAGTSYASAALLERIGAKPHHSGLRKIEMMLGASSRVMEVYRVKLNSVRGNFEMEAEVTKVEKLHLMMIDNPRYKKLVEKHPHLKGVTMDDNDERPRLPVHVILGNSECPRISTTEQELYKSSVRFGSLTLLVRRGHRAAFEYLELQAASNSTRDKEIYVRG